MAIQDRYLILSFYSGRVTDGVPKGISKDDNLFFKREAHNLVLFQ